MVAIDALAKLISGSSNYFHDQGTLGFGASRIGLATGSRRLGHAVVEEGSCKDSSMVSG